MNKEKTWGLFGYGNIGQELAEQVLEIGRSEVLGLSPLPTFVVRSSGVMESDGITPTRYDSIDDIANLPDVNFIALPPSDDGEPAFSLIANLLDKGSKVITAEKSSLANHFPILRSISDNFNNLGINATVGGGTKPLEAFEHNVHQKDAIAQIHLNQSGTMTAIRGLIRLQGLNLNESLSYCKSVGYAEPGSSTPYDSMRAEMIDALMKAGIFFNKSGLSEQILDWQKLKTHIDNNTLANNMDNGSALPYFVSLYRQAFHSNFEHPEETGISGKSSLYHDGWKIVAGFRDPSKNPHLLPLLELEGPSNGFVVAYGPEGGHGSHVETGKNGAGATATTRTMLGDYAQIMLYNSYR